MGVMQLYLFLSIQVKFSGALAPMLSSCSGLLSTDLGRHISSFGRRIIHFFCQSPPDGAITQLWAGTSPDAAFLNGKYLIPRPRVGQPAPGTLDPELSVKLWEWSEEQVRDR